MRAAHRTMLVGVALALCLAALAGCGGSAGGGSAGATPGGTASASSAAVTEQQFIGFVQRAAEHVKAVGKTQALGQIAHDEKGNIGIFDEALLEILLADYHHFAGLNRQYGRRTRVIVEHPHLAEQFARSKH